MTLSNPYALAGLVLLPVMYILYSWVSRDIIPVPSIMIWKRMPGTSSRNSRSARGVDPGLLFYLIAAASGILALSDPFLLTGAAARPLSEEPEANIKPVLRASDAPAADNPYVGVIRIYGRTDSNIERAINAMPGGKSENVWGDPPTTGPAVVIRAAVRSVPSGKVAVVDPAGTCGPIQMEGTMPVSSITEDRPDDPLLSGVDIGTLEIRETARVRLPEGSRVLISAEGMPAVAVVPNGDGEILYVGFDPSRGGWAGRPSFPIFWYNFFADGNSSAGDSPVEDATRSDEHDDIETDTDVRLAPWLLLVMMCAISGLWLVRSRGEKRLSALPPE